MMKRNLGLVAAIWTSALFAMIAAAFHGSWGVVLAWSAAGATAATLVLLIWPERTWSTALGTAGVMWQFALAASHWPPAWSLPADVMRVAPGWPAHVLVIGAVLLALAAAFAVAFVVPGLLLWLCVGQAARTAHAGEPAAMQRLAALIRGDHPLRGAWQEYLALLPPPSTHAGPDSSAGARASARTVFEPYAVASTRLRLEFFRNLPGVFTGIGIIGTFSGLILGLRGFVISEDPAVMQRSLTTLLTSVWESFGVSALAIALAIAVTVTEKLVFGAIAGRLAELAGALDAINPPMPQESAVDRTSALVALLRQQLEQQRLAPSPAAAPAPAAPPDAPGSAAAAPLRSSAGGATSVEPAGITTASEVAAALPLHELTASNRQVSESVAGLLSQLPELFAAHLGALRQQQEQNTSALKSLGSRLETVASGIEASGRRTLEFVSQRLVDAETTMLTRHQVVAEQMQELVQRIEVLCGVLQQDRLLHREGVIAPLEPSAGVGGLPGRRDAWPRFDTRRPSPVVEAGVRTETNSGLPSFGGPFGDQRYEWDLPPGGRGGFGP